MHFMNTWEIDQAATRYAYHTILGPATRVLSALRDVVDSNSDGWHSWPKPARAADQLMTLIERPAEAPADALTKALRPIKAFRNKYKSSQPRWDWQELDAAIQAAEQI